MAKSDAVAAHLAVDVEHTHALVRPVCHLDVVLAPEPLKLQVFRVHRPLCGREGIEVVDGALCREYVVVIALLLGLSVPFLPVALQGLGQIAEAQAHQVGSRVDRLLLKGT